LVRLAELRYFKELYTGTQGMRWRTSPQVGRSRVRFPKLSLKCFIYLIFLAALWTWGGPRI